MMIDFNSIPEDDNELASFIQLDYSTDIDPGLMDILPSVINNN